METSSGHFPHPNLLLVLRSEAATCHVGAERQKNMSNIFDVDFFTQVAFQGSNKISNANSEADAAERSTLNRVKCSRQLPVARGSRRHFAASFIRCSHALFHLTRVLESLKIKPRSNPRLPREFTPKFTCPRGGCNRQTSLFICARRCGLMCPPVRQSKEMTSFRAKSVECF